jgi:hypothetical protein
MDRVALKQPDRMPTAMFATFFLAKFGGVSHRGSCTTTSRRRKSPNGAAEFEPDTTPGAQCYIPCSTPRLQSSGRPRRRRPSALLHLDREYMKPEEYDEFILIRLHSFDRICRASSRFQGMEELPYLPGRIFA